MRQNARPIVFIWFAIVLGIMWMVEQAEGYAVPTGAKAFLIAYLGEWLVERGIRKGKQRDD